MKVGLVAYACSPDQGSEPGVGWNVATSLTRDHDVWVFTRASNRTAIERATRSGKWERLRFVYHDLPGLFGVKRLPLGIYPYHYLWQMSVGAVVGRVHAEVGLDVAHQITFGSFRYPSSLQDLHEVPYVLGPVGGAEEAPLPSWGSFGFRGMILETMRWLSNRVALADPWLRSTYRHAAIVLCVSPDSRAYLERGFGLEGRTLLMPSIGVESVGKADRVPGNSGRLRALFVGRLVHWKGVTIAVESVHQARSTGSDVTLTILGDGPDTGRLDRLVKRRGMAEAVTHILRVPSAEAVRELYKRHDVLVFPSLHEAGGMAVVEAMAEGLPVVCVDIGGPAVSIAGGGGIAVAPGGHRQISAEMAHVLGELANSPARVAEMSAAARRTVAEEYTWDAKRARLSEVYRRIAG